MLLDCKMELITEIQFITVEGIAGGSYDGDEDMRPMFTIRTKEFTVVTVAQGVYSNGTPYYLTAQV